MTLAYFLLAQLVAGNLTYQQARAQVGGHESSLSAEQGNRLYDAQEIAMNEAVPKCMDVLRPHESLKVSLVLSIGESGKPVAGWLEEENSFARCMTEQLMTKSFIVPPKLPFFTVFELNLGVERKP